MERTNNNSAANKVIDMVRFVDFKHEMYRIGEADQMDQLKKMAARWLALDNMLHDTGHVCSSFREAEEGLDEMHAQATIALAKKLLWLNVAGKKAAKCRSGFILWRVGERFEDLAELCDLFTDLY